MLIHWNELKKLPVYTKMGMRLGRISGMELDAESHLIRAYFVRKDFLSNELSISRNQIISIGKDKVVVEDGVVSDMLAEQSGVVAREEIAPISMSEIKN